MITYFQAAFIILILILAWVFFRYLIRMVKSNEAIQDSLEEISLLLKEAAGSFNKEKKNEEPKQ